MTKDKNNPSFEHSIDRLETIVNQMESGDATLKKSLEWFEEGMALIISCQTQLNDAEQKVQELIKNSEGNLTLKDSV